jgi:predicted RNA polymerase sigma factor
VGPERGERLASVLEVIYLIFNEGYSATAGDDWMRPALCQEAIRLAGLLAELAPREPEVHGLLALTQLHASRSPARTGPSGEPILLRDQDRTRWDQLLIRRGLATLDRAVELDAAAGPYTLQASIAACHAQAPTVAETDWRRVAELYDELARVAASPVVELNRAVAVAMVDGPAAGLALMDRLSARGGLDDYPYLHAARADLLRRLGRREEAADAYRRARCLMLNTAEQAFLDRRLREVGATAAGA